MKTASLVRQGWTPAQLLLEVMPWFAPPPPSSSIFCCPHTYQFLNLILLAFSSPLLLPSSPQLPSRSAALQLILVAVLGEYRSLSVFVKPVRGGGRELWSTSVSQVEEGGLGSGGMILFLSTGMAAFLVGCERRKGRK